MKFFDICNIFGACYIKSQANPDFHGFSIRLCSPEPNEWFFKS